MSRRAQRLLALDAAGRACSVAVWAEGALRALRHEAMERGQSERLLPLAQAALAEAGLGFAALEAVAVTLGPGGFTGVRIGLAAAEGLALAWDLPLLGLSSFAVAAAAVPPASRGELPLLVLLEAKRAEVYACAFDAAGAELLPGQLVAPEVLADLLPPGPLLLTGEAMAQALPALQAAGRDCHLVPPGEPAAASLARLAAALPLEAAGPQPQPLYLRPPDTTRPKPRRGQG